MLDQCKAGAVVLDGTFTIALDWHKSLVSVQRKDCTLS